MDVCFYSDTLSMVCFSDSLSCCYKNVQGLCHISEITTERLEKVDDVSGIAVDDI
jgi:polyribonucleotide nucleotidyltransferase